MFSWLFVYSLRKSRVRAGTSEITFRLIKWRYFSFLAQTIKKILHNLYGRHHGVAAEQRVPCWFRLRSVSRVDHPAARQTSHPFC